MEEMGFRTDGATWWRAGYRYKSEANAVANALRLAGRWAKALRSIQAAGTREAPCGET